VRVVLAAALIALAVCAAILLVLALRAARRRRGVMADLTRRADLAERGLRAIGHELDLQQEANWHDPGPIRSIVRNHTPEGDPS
jgi:hypothetical protein